MEPSSSATMSKFDSWVHQHNGAPGIEEQVCLAKHLCDLASQRKQPPSSLHPTEKMVRLPQASSSTTSKNEFDLVSWKGVSLWWFQRILLETEEMKIFMEFGCRMWFVRNRCITEMLRRRGVTGNGSIADHIDKFTHQDYMSETRENDVEVVQDECNRILDEASCFVSYTGELPLSRFKDLIGHPRLSHQFLWWDAVCVCQFSWTERKDEEMNQFKASFLHQLRKRIGSIGMTALLVNRWDDIMATLGKIWVLWEIFSTVNGKSSLDVLFTEFEEGRFINDVFHTNDGFDRINNSIARVDAATAYSFVPGDREMILGLMEETDGVFAVNRDVMACLRKWFVDNAEEYYRKLDKQGADLQPLRGTLAGLHMNFGDIENALQLNQERVEKLKQTYGMAHKLTLTAMRQLAHTFIYEMTPSKLFKAEKLLRDIIDICNSQFEDHNEIAMFAHQSLSIVMSSTERLQEAEFHIRKAISTQEYLHGSSHPLTRVFKESLNDILIQLEDEHLNSDEVKSDIFQHLQDMRDQFGSKHANTLMAITTCANALEAQEKYPEAEVLYREILRTMTEQLGSDDSETRAGMKALASVLERQGKMTEAETLFRNALRIERAILGDEHVTTLNTMNELCNILDANGKEGEAEPLSLQLLTLSETVNGTTHPDTLTFAQNRSQILFGMDRDEEAEKLLREVVRKREETLGASHPDTVDVSVNLGIMLAQLDKVEEAISVIDNAANTSEQAVERNRHGFHFAEHVLSHLGIVKHWTSEDENE